MRYTKVIFSVFLLTLLSCQNQAKNIQSPSDTAGKINPISEERETPKKINGQPRFSLIQSTIAAKGTYKLDSYSGDVYQLVLSSNNTETWEKLNKLSHSTPDVRLENFNNYILFVSTIAMRFTYLMNVNTGATWQLTQDSQTEENYFSPIE